MELFEVMRTTFAAREFRGDPVADEVLYRILENARFAPSGGNRQGWRVIIVRDRVTRQQLAELAVPAARRYVAQLKAGERPWNTIVPSRLNEAAIESTPVPPVFTDPFRTASVVLVICVDLKVVASMDQFLDRIGVISGASIYPFVWNILLGARHEGLGGTITTLAAAREAEVQRLLGIPSDFALAAVVPLGRPVKQLSRLKRLPVEAFAMRERFDGDPLGSDGA